MLSDKLKKSMATTVSKTINLKRFLLEQARYNQKTCPSACVSFFSTNNRPQTNRQTICNNGDPPANVQPYRGFCRNHLPQKITLKKIKRYSHQKDFGMKSLGVSQKSKAIKCVGSVKVDPFSIGILWKFPTLG